MTTAAFFLVLLSALAHASWNLQLKRSTHKVAFLGLATAIAVAILAPPAVAVAARQGFGPKELAYGAVTALLHAAYGTLLSRGYRLGDLSVVYPVSRGMGLALIPLGGAFLLGEHVSAEGGIGIALIAAGVYAVHIEPGAVGGLVQPLRSAIGPAGRTPLITGGVIAAYSLWDKNALDVLSPIPLNEFGMIGLSATLIPLAFRGGLPQLSAEWRQRPRSIVAAGVMIPTAYLLVLIALTTSRVSYVGPAREIGIVFGTLSGVFLLREGYGRLRIPAACLIVAGVVTLALAP